MKDIGMVNMRKKVIIIGAGGHAKVIIEILKADVEYELIGCTDVKGKGDPVLGLQILGDDSILPDLYRKGITFAFVAIGDNQLRQKIARNAKEIGFELINAISFSSYIAGSSILGEGIAIMPGASLTAEVVIHDYAIINTGSSIDHESIIGESAHIAPGCNLSGKVVVGEGTFLGTGTSVIDGISIGSWSIVGAGSVVVKDFPDRCIGFGVPAIVKRQVVKKEEEGCE